MTDQKHAKLSPSGSHRWINCPGSIQLCEKGPPAVESDYATEGSAAHALAELCLNNWVDADSYLDKKVYTHKGKDYIANDDMCDAVQVYLDAIRLLVTKEKVEQKKVIFSVEQKFSLGWVHKDMFGSNDCCVYEVSKKRMHIFDYKHGMGVVVDPEWNPQLLMYALGAIHGLWDSQTKTTKMHIDSLKMIDEVVLTIVQPRVFGNDTPIKSWSITAANLYHWGLHILKPAAIATENPKALLRVGKHCGFCNALAVCPEQLKHSCAVAKVEFGKRNFPDPSSLTPDDIKKVMEVSSTISAWVTQVKQYAHNQMEMGIGIPGFKLVARKSNRRWVDESCAGDALEQVLGVTAFERKVLSVAKAEKALKKLNISPESCLNGLWEKPNAGSSMAPDTDRRKEIMPPVAMDFIEDMDFLD